MTALRAVLWDMDGVLVDTGEFHFHSWMSTLPEFGIPFSYEKFRITFGMNNEGILRLLLGDRFNQDLYLEISDRKEANFRKTIRGQVQLLPGVLPLLDEVNRANISQAIGSSAPRANIDVILAELKLKSYFQAIISAVRMPSKPDPTVFLTAAQNLDIPPENCIVIEDAVTGVEASRRAGMKCVAVTTTNTVADLQSADLVVDRLDTITVADLIALMK